MSRYLYFQNKIWRNYEVEETFYEARAVERCEKRVDPKIMQNGYLLFTTSSEVAKFGLDTAENEPSEVASK